VSSKSRKKNPQIAPNLGNVFATQSD
jgi:hypothetical protein